MSKNQDFMVHVSQVFFCCRCSCGFLFYKNSSAQRKKNRNVRLRKLQGGDVKGTFLAYAGLKRMSMEAFQRAPPFDVKNDPFDVK